MRPGRLSARNTYNGAVVHYLDATGTKRAVTVDEREQEKWPRRYLLFDLAIPITEQGARAIAATLLAETIG